jgi:hypothetical protein
MTLIFGMMFTVSNVLCEPEAFYLFVLSHGESGGRILTDHFKISAQADTNFVFELQTYTTSDVWSSLADLKVLQSSTKILLFAVRK